MSALAKRLDELQKARSTSGSRTDTVNAELSLAWGSMSSKLRSQLSQGGFVGPPKSSTWPSLEIAVTGHEEEHGHTMYFVDCVVSYPGNESFAWRTHKRLCQMRESLHDAVKEELQEARYAGMFRDEPFARYGGFPGTTARLHAWCGALAKGLSNGRLSPRLTAHILQFLEIPKRELQCKADEAAVIHDEVVKACDLASESSACVIAEPKAESESSGLEPPRTLLPVNLLTVS